MTDQQSNAESSMALHRLRHPVVMITTTFIVALISLFGVVVLHRLGMAWKWIAVILCFFIGGLAGSEKTRKLEVFNQ